MTSSTKQTKHKPSVSEGLQLGPTNQTNQNKAERYEKGPTKARASITKVRSDRAPIVHPGTNE
ncbi:hypothetical protein N7517_000934 [Penicillium concentricum]|uniref:Uncharacterized protein n=1 Tax=Penicillium concentricum TaxID=293559 RepID=A0A9W9SV14_9EURO|nr:uncharacterized protein N7517_000934 [Penicillium concentricum]KAJ5383023.1 hypothetical protein N7517_000934 [Penicillium concentricum]